MPVIFVDLPPEKAHLLNLALNKISGSWDQELLARLLLPNQQGLEEGQVRYWCSACQKSFVVDDGQEPEACPEGHRAQDAEPTA